MRSHHTHWPLLLLRPQVSKIALLGQTGEVFNVAEIKKAGMVEKEGC
jgi:hypothetical protein